MSMYTARNQTKEKAEQNQGTILTWIDQAMANDPRKDNLKAMFENPLFAERFFWAPASSKYHNAYAGGLFDHTINVIKQIFLLQSNHPQMAPRQETLFLTALCHDIGKCGDLQNPYYLSSGDSFSYNKAIQMPHEMLSLFWLQHFDIKLEVDELQAIAYHNGPYTDGYSQISWKEYPATVFVHDADMWATRYDKFME